MASDIAVRAEHLGKKYMIGRTGERERYVALRDVLARGASDLRQAGLNALRGKAPGRTPKFDEFWALRDVNFEIKRGEVVGIIGRNGAGKSTLLKILSRITEPSEGRVTIAGRVASLLEVGTGFHPELTGRENIFLNGAILGMSQAETRRKFDEIVAFAGVDRFLETPVKRYSSGMYVRLAFAVAAHLEPEILVIDEVLAVGDAEFQKKCLGKMSEVASGGRTVLFVSHNLGAVSSLCGKALLLNHGKVQAFGDTGDIIGVYLATAETASRVEFLNNGSRPAIDSIELDEAALAQGDLSIRIGFSSPFPLAPVVGGVALRSASGQPVWGSNSRFHPAIDATSSLSRGVIDCTSRNLPLAPGIYSISAWLAGWHEDYDYRPDVLTFSFRAGEEQALRPSAEVLGNLDWDAVWRAQETADAE